MGLAWVNDRRCSKAWACLMSLRRACFSVQQDFRRGNANEVVSMRVEYPRGSNCCSNFLCPESFSSCWPLRRKAVVYSVVSEAGRPAGRPALWWHGLWLALSLHSLAVVLCVLEVCWIKDERGGRVAVPWSGCRAAVGDREERAAAYFKCLWCKDYQSRPPLSPRQYWPDSSGFFYISILVFRFQQLHL